MRGTSRALRLLGVLPVMLVLGPVHAREIDAGATNEVPPRFLGAVETTAGPTGMINRGSESAVSFSSAVSSDVDGVPVRAAPAGVPTARVSGTSPSATGVELLATPVISSFTATPAKINRGQTTTLAWASTGGTSAAIDNGVGQVPTTGSKKVSPTKTTTYTLGVLGTGGAYATRSVTVTVVVAPPVISSFTASPSTVARGGDPSVLSWSSTGGMTATIDKGVGTVPTSGSTTVKPCIGTTYTLSVTGAGGTTTKQVTVNVTLVAPAPTIGSFTASPGTITAGQSTTLTWSSLRGLSASIDQGIGAVSTSGSRTVSPTKTTTYTLTVTGICGTAVKTVTVNVCAPASISSFAATPPTIKRGQSATLAWSSSGGKTASIDNGVGSVDLSGSKSVSPVSTTTYTLTVTAGFCPTVTRQTTVTVLQPQPVIQSFVAKPPAISRGQSSTLWWESTNGTSAAIDNGVGGVQTSGSVLVSPSQTTTYTLTVTGPGGASTRQVTVSVGQNLPIISSFTASPPTIAPGQSSTLAWSSTGGTTATIDNGIGAVPVSGQWTVSPTMSTTYTLTVSNAGGAVTKQVAVTVTAGVPVIADFSASPSTITPGQSSTLAWSSTGGTTATIDNGIGAVPTSGSRIVSPAQTTTYTLGVTGTGGTTTRQVTVGVSAGKTSYILPSSAFRSGANAAEYRTDVRILNQGSDAVTVNAYFYDQMTASTFPSGPVRIEARSQAAFDNVLQSLFGRTLVNASYGPIRFESTGPVLVAASVNNVNACGRGAVSGQWLPGVAETTALTAGVIGQLAVCSSTSSGYRTNVVVMNPAQAAANVTLRVRRGGGVLVSTQPVGPLPPNGFTQIGLETCPGVAGMTDTNLWLEFTSDRPVIAYATIIHNVSGDPFAVVASADGASSGGGPYTYFLPSSAFRTGANAAEYRTDVRIVNPTTSRVTVIADLFDQMTATRVTAGPILIEGRNQAAFDNVLKSLFNRSLANGSYGPIRFESTGPILVASSVNNVNACGNGAISGQWLPGIPTSGALRAGVIGQLAASGAATSGYRTNLVFVNPSAGAATVTAKVRRGAGTLLSTRTIGPLAPIGFIQLGLDTFPGVAGVTDTNLWMEFASDQPVIAYATVIHNVSGDPFAVVAADDAPTEGPEETVMLPGGVPLVMVRIPAGTFQMGSPSTEQNRGSEQLHSVTLTRPYWIGKHEVTQRQWEAVMGSNPAYFPGCPDCPVERVSWDNIRGPSGFIASLNQLLGTTKFRLPTDAEWERAARAGTQTRFWFGDALGGDDLCGVNAEAMPYLWWCGNSEMHTQTVGSKAGSAWGLFDVHGNVWEWVEDWFGAYAGTAETDPKGPASGDGKVVRGGSFGDNLRYQRSAQRYYFTTDYGGNHVGLRLARTD